MSGIEISVTDFGATGDGTTDDTATIQAAINSAQDRGVGLFFPRAIGGFYKIGLQTLTLMGKARRTGLVVQRPLAMRWAPGAVLRLMLPPDTPVVPLIDIQSQAQTGDVNLDASGTILMNPQLDHNAAHLGDPDDATGPYGDIPGAGSCLIVAADHVHISHHSIKNGWNNGIFTGSYAWGWQRSSGSAQFEYLDSPKYTIIENGYTENCGCGYEHGSEFAKGDSPERFTGCGVDIAGAFTNVSKCIDNGSTGGFGAENYGRISPVTFSDLIACNTGSGYGFFLSNPQLSAKNLSVLNASSVGAWLDGERVIVEGLKVDGSGKQGVIIKSHVGKIIGGNISQYNKSNGNFGGVEIDQSTCKRCSLIDVDIPYPNTPAPFPIVVTTPDPDAILDLLGGWIDRGTAGPLVNWESGGAWTPKCNAWPA
jgi:hypothetical protein